MLKAIVKLLSKVVGAFGALAAYLAGRKAVKHETEVKRRKTAEAEVDKWRSRPRNHGELLNRLRQLTKQTK